MGGIYNRIERNAGYRLEEIDVGDTKRVWQVFGPDAAGQYWTAGPDSLNGIFYRLSARGLVLSTVVIGGSGTCGAIDKYGFPWVGTTSAGTNRIHKISLDGSSFSYLDLTDGINGYKPFGMLSLGDYLYVVGINAGTTDVRIFRIDITPGAEAVDSYGSALAGAGSVENQMLLAPRGTTDIWCTDPNRTNALIFFNVGSLGATSLPLTYSTGAATSGLMGIHYAFGYFWVGGDTLDSVGSSPPQLIRVGSDATVERLLQFSDALRLSAITSDERFLYVAATGKSGASNIGDNRVEKILPNNENLLLHSEAFDDSDWTKVGATVNADVDPAPPGFSGNSDQLVDDLSTGAHSVSQTLTISSRYTFSVYASAINKDWVRLTVDNPAGSIYFNVSTGAVGSVSGDLLLQDLKYSIEDLGSGWYRVSASLNAPAPLSTIAFVIAAADADGSETYTGTSSRALNLFGAQVAQHPELTSYVPTTVLVLTEQITIEDTFDYDGGQDEEIRSVLVVSDDPPSPYPDPSLVDAVIWLRGDDPGVTLDATGVTSVPNQGPQNLERALYPRGTLNRPALGQAPNGLNALVFDGSDDRLDLLTPPTYSVLSTYFNGTDEYVTMGDVYGFEYTDSFSFSLWFKWSAADYAMMLFKQEAATSYQGYSVIGLTDGRMQFALVNDEATTNKIQVRTTASFNDGAWHHLAVTWLGSGSPAAANAKIYVDGSLQAQDTPVDALSGSIQTAAVFSLGQRAAAVSSTGSQNLDEVAIYDKELSGAEVSAIYGLGVPADLGALASAANLISWWRMGEGDANPLIRNLVDGGGVAIFPDIPDETANENDGTQINALASDNVDWVPWSAFSQYCYNFDGSAEYITMGNVVHFEYSFPFAISCWFRSTDLTGYLVSKMEAPTVQRGYGLLLSGGQLVFNLINNGGGAIYSQLVTDDTFNDGAWHHVVATYTAATPGAAADMDIFVDGVDVPTTVGLSALGSNTILNAADFNLAGRTNGSDLYNGYLTEVALYDRALTLADAQWIYNSGTPRDLRIAGYDPLTTSIEFNNASTDESVSFADYPDYEWSDPFSVGIWVKMTAGVAQYLIAKKNGALNYQGWHLQVSAGNDIKFSLDGGSNLMTATFGYDLADDTWHHVLIRYDGSGLPANVRCSVDGVDQGSPGTSGSVTSGSILTNNPLTVGQMYPGWTTGVFTGRACHSAMWDKQLSAAEAAEVFGMGMPQDLLSLSTASNLVHWCALGDGCSLGAGNFPDLSTQGNDGTFNNGDSGDFVTDTPDLVALAAWWRIGEAGEQPQSSWTHKVAQWVLGFGAAETTTITDAGPFNSPGTLYNMDAADVTTDTPGGISEYSCTFRQSYTQWSTESVDFDGLNDYITMGDVHGFEYTNDFSVSCWIKTTATSGYIVSKMLASGNFTGWGFVLDSGGRVNVYLRNDNSPLNQIRVNGSTAGLNDGAWHHIVFTWKGNVSPVAADLTIYVDGAVETPSVIDDALSATIVSAAALTFGARNGGDSFWNGRLDEVLIYGKELSGAEVSWLYAHRLPREPSIPGAPSGLYSHWTMGDIDTYPTILDWPRGPAATTGTNAFWEIATDSIARGTTNNMDASNITTDMPNSAIGYSTTFNGTDEWVNCGNYYDIDYLDAATISIWVKRSIGVSGTPISKREISNTRGWELYISGTEVVFWLSNDSGTNRIDRRCSWTAFDDGGWHHICVTKQGGTSAASSVLIYIDGALQSMTTTTDGLTATTNTSANLNFGRVHYLGGSPTRYYTGQITEVAIYSAELSSGDVSAIYNGGVPTELRALSSASNLAGWWGVGPAYPRDGTMQGMDAGDIVTDAPTNDPKGMWCNVASTVYGPYNFGSPTMFTLSGWVKTTATTGWLWGNGNVYSGTNWQGYGVYLDGTGKPKIVWGNPAGSRDEVVSSVAINDGDWHHVVVSIRHDFSGFRGASFWIDGVLDGSTTTIATSGTANGVGFSIGARDDVLHDPLVGQIDEVSVWSKVFTQSDVDEVYNSGAPADLRDHTWANFLRGWWRMGDPYYAPGTTVNMEYTDKIPTGPGATGYTTRSLQMYSNEYVEIAHAPEIDFDFDETFSISAWIFPLGLNGYRAIWYKKSGVGISFTHYGGSGGATYDARNNLRIIFDGTTGYWEVYPGGWSMMEVPYGEWFHLVMTHDGTNDANGIKLYINGEQWPTWVRYNFAFGGGDTMKNSGNVWVGREASYWVGNHDELSVWDKELTQADVTELYNGGNPADLTGHTSVANLVGWWRMGEGAIDGTMVNMNDGNFVPDTPALGAPLPLMHDGSSYTLAVVFESVAATTQAVIGTIATTIDNADTGAALVYDGSNENVRFVIANGSGVDFVMDKTTATSSVPANQVTIVTVRVDFSVTPNAEAEIRIWSSGDLTEYIEEIGTATSETPSSSAVGTFLVGASGEGALDGSFLEGTVLDRVVTDNELLDLVRYLTRWM